MTSAHSEPILACRARAARSGCSTIIVGKAASATGEILIGHNEDNDLRIVTSQYWVPPADHAPGERMTFEPDAVKIPQASRTFGYFWVQTLHPAGSSYSDNFVNEKGVVIVSNNCNNTFERGESVREGGIGYGIRRILAERAATAREAVEIAISLQTKYGYRDQGRTYTVADRNEAWQIMLLRGHRYVARKVQDDEVVFVANAFSLGRLNDVPEGDILISPDLIEHAIQTKRYVPAHPGDFSDFSFCRAYQPIERRAADWNKNRSQTALAMLTGTSTDAWSDQEAFPYAVRIQRKLTVEDVKAVMSAHWPHEKRSGFMHQSMRDICNIGTFYSVVFELNAEPSFIRGWQTMGRPCQLPYVPFFPLAKPAEDASFMSPETAAAEHFHASRDRFDHRSGLALYAFLDAQNLSDYIGDAPLRAVKADLEARWREEEEDVRRQAAFLKSAVSKEKALDYLHAYGAEAFARAEAAMVEAIEAMESVEVQVLADSLSLSDVGTVDVAVFGSASLDVRTIDLETTRFGVTYPDSDVAVNAKREKALKAVYRDLNGDGRLDAVFTFKATAAAAWGFEGVKTDLWFFAEAEGRKIGGFDVVRIVK